MNRTGAPKPGGGTAPDGPATRDTLAKAIDEEEANLHRLEAEAAEAKTRLGSLRAALAQLDAPVKAKPAEPSGIGPRTPTDKVNLFRQLFRGRPDLYPTRFVSKKTGKLRFQGTLTAVQEQAARAQLAQDAGVFVAPPGVGKTVVGTYLVAARACSTLVLVQRMFEKRLRGYRAIGYARGEAPLGYAEPSDDRVIEYDEGVLAALDQEDDFA